MYHEATGKQLQIPVRGTLEGDASRMRVLRAIEAIFNEGYIPTVREIAKRAGLSLSTAHAHLQRLTNMGLLRRLTSVGGGIIVYLIDEHSAANITQDAIA